MKNHLRITKKSFLLFLAIYLGAMFSICLLIGILLLSRSNIPRSEVLDIWIRAIEYSLYRPIFYILSFLPYLLYYLIKSLIKDYGKARWLGLAKGIALRGLSPIAILWFSLQGIDAFRLGEKFDYEWDLSVENTQEKIRDLYQVDGKHRGIHAFDLERDSSNIEDLKVLLKNNVEWITLTPFIPQDEYNTPSLSGEYRDSLAYFQKWHELKEPIQSYGFHLMIKPHVWLLGRNSGKWRSDIAMKNEKDWQTWFDQYTYQMLAYARLAASMEAELFCIGAELQQTVLQRPDDWRELIRKIKTIYPGRLTYAANWNEEADQVPFWDVLDYVGIQAYYPIAKRSNPNLKELEKGWRDHFPIFEQLHESTGKPILFTEIGYKSTPDAGIRPWEWNKMGDRFYKRISHRTQARCYEAFFNTVWQQEWMAGAHLWEWQCDWETDGNNNAFSIQSKPALNVVAKRFGSK